MGQGVISQNIFIFTIGYREYDLRLSWPPLLFAGFRWDCVYRRDFYPSGRDEEDILPPGIPGSASAVCDHSSTRPYIECRIDGSRPPFFRGPPAWNFPALTLAFPNQLDPLDGFINIRFYQVGQAQPPTKFQQLDLFARKGFNPGNPNFRRVTKVGMEKRTFDRPDR